MSDQDRRRLERLAQLGDTEAKAQLDRLTQRLEQPPCLRAENPTDHDLRPSTPEEDKELLERWPDAASFMICTICNGVQRRSILQFPSSYLGKPTDSKRSSPFPKSPFHRRDGSLGLKLRKCERCERGEPHECRT